MYVCSSIPIIYKRLHEAEEKDSGLYLYYNFMEYLVANQNTNRTQLQQILTRLADNPVGIPIEDGSKAFNEEVAEHLKEYFDSDRVVTNARLGNHIFPVMIKPSLKRKRTYLLLVDSYAKNAEAFSFVWQRQQQKDLEAQGYHFIQIWSKDWWKNPREEARQLAGLIIGDDNDFS